MTSWILLALCLAAISAALVWLSIKGVLPAAWTKWLLVAAASAGGVALVILSFLLGKGGKTTPAPIVVNPDPVVPAAPPKKEMADLDTRIAVTDKEIKAIQNGAPNEKADGGSGIGGGDAGLGAFVSERESELSVKS